MFAPVVYGASPWRLIPRNCRFCRLSTYNTVLLLVMGGFVLLSSPLRRTQQLDQYITNSLIEEETSKEVQYMRSAPALFKFEKVSQNMAPNYPASFLHSMSPASFPYTKQLSRTGPPEIESSPEEDLLDYVLEGFTVPTYYCKRMVRLGGSYCTRKPEAEKVICFDAGLAPSPEDCLVYSFGVGHEMSFDQTIANFGCNVFSFDADYNHMRYPRNVYPGVTFLKVRLGWSRFVNILTDPSGRFPFVYRPMDDLMLNLGHKDAQLAILKIDIENSEWDVFEKSLFNTRILERTKQLALEVHLDFMYPQTQFDLHPDGMHAGLKQHARVVKGLHERGFRLAYYEPNYNVPANTSLHGRTFHVYFETVWINTHLWEGEYTQKLPDLTDFDTLPPVEVIHNNIV